MERGTLGSLIFIGGTLLLAGGSTSESSAMADESPLAGIAGAPVKGGIVGTPTVVSGNGQGADVEKGKTVIAANAGLKGVAPAELGASGKCGEGMVEIEGDYCPFLEQKCLRWIDPETTIPRRCAEFAPTGTCQTKTSKKHFCIDRFEYPNKVGEKPVVMKTFYEAENACKSQGKRLCGDSEWTLACEGQERLPYPYGYQRNSEACNIDKPHPDVNEKALANPITRDAEVQRLWQGEPSGARESCVSPYGAFDMTGNVDEWVVNETGMPYKSGLKGGYWGPVRDRCRPITTAHNETFAFYQIGFRCCSEVPAGPGEAPSTSPGTAPSNGKPSINPAPSSLTGT